MATRKPFVNVSGEIKELPVGDSLDGISLGAVTFNLVNGELIANSLVDFAAVFSIANGDLIVN